MKYDVAELRELEEKATQDPWESIILTAGFDSSFAVSLGSECFLVIEYGEEFIGEPPFKVSSVEGKLHIEENINSGPLEWRRKYPDKMPGGLSQPDSELIAATRNALPHILDDLEEYAKFKDRVQRGLNGPYPDHGLSDIANFAEIAGEALQEIGNATGKDWNNYEELPPIVKDMRDALEAWEWYDEVRRLYYGHGWKSPAALEIINTLYDAEDNKNRYSVIVSSLLK